MPETSGADTPMYHAGMRALQDAAHTRRLADRLQQLTLHTAFSEDDCAFIESAPMFFLATADAQGQPDCSYKGGLPGFVRVVAPDTLAFPDYDGNGMFRSLGNVLTNPAVGMLFIDFASPKRLRVNGHATVSAEDALLAEFEGAQRIVRVHATRIFPNCPRYIHRMQLVEPSTYAPRAGHVPPVPNWKRWDALQDVLPPGTPR
jgi:predicted pyridoxine 5'-phosphate oxidase superfamily flavin-nucleotide-binding protein